MSVEQWRGGLLIKTVQLIAPKTLSEIVSVGGETLTEFFLETAMPGQNVSMTRIRENQATGAITVDFSSGTQMEFGSWEAVGEIADAIDSTPDLAQQILLGKAFRESPDGTNKTTQLGASVSTNLLASDPIVYTAAE